MNVHQLYSSSVCFEMIVQNKKQNRAREKLNSCVIAQSAHAIRMSFHTLLYTLLDDRELIALGLICEFDFEQIGQSTLNED